MWPIQRADRAVGGFAKVEPDNLPGIAGGLDPPLVNEETLLTKAQNGSHVMADEKNGSPFLCHVAHLSQAFLLEVCVADGQHFIDQQDFWLQMCRYAECQPHIHATGIVFDRCVDELLNLGKRYDLVKLAANLGPPHAQDGAVEVNVLPASQFAVEASANFQ